MGLLTHATPLAMLRRDARQRSVTMLPRQARRPLLLHAGRTLIIWADDAAGALLPRQPDAAPY